MKKTVHGWEIISNLDIRLYQDEAGGVVILLDKDGFGFESISWTYFSRDC